MGRITEAVKHLLIINVIMFIATQVYGDQMTDLMAIWFPMNEHFHWWQIVTHMFMHGSVTHIFFNMYALWAFGSPLEQMWGRNKFLFFYFSAGLGAALIHTGVNYYEFQQGFNALIGAGVDGDQILSLLREGKYDTRWPELVSSPSEVKEMLSAYWQPAVGASGAIYGILVAFAMMFPNVELFLLFIPVPIKAKYFIPVLVGLDLFSGLTGYSIFGGGIAHFAHVGGALFGFIMMWYWKRNQFNNNRWD
ncbi:rhomboid family intramembrane serine protease [Imtechella halotolerans]|uniref:Serine endopeptidase n=1 Tax=Imtechella halotolerans K1 TaxID=946077 RepID=I0W7L4_9FLAO|nr:rhomboid family intramembrane serine protease [Imtechella halotolerans]EID72380.1 serine endopeptidase [Imtechella halotolerans K1]WMQ64481.1 rhomboid family intramembrane serine protease [Imtechella halotolerans]